MSNLVLPTLPGLAWSTFRSPEFDNITKDTASGRTFTRIKWSSPRWNIKRNYEFLRADSNQELQTLVGFFNQHYGNGETWLFDDPDDNTATNQQFGVGNGTTTQFQLVRTLGGFNEAVYELNGEPIIFYNGQPANLITNSSFETKVSGIPVGYEEYNNGGAATTWTNPSGSSGSNAFGLQANASTTSTFGLHSSASTGGGVSTGWQPGCTYTISFYAYKVNGAGWGGMALYWNLSPASTVAISNPNLTSSWQRYVFTITWGSVCEPLGALFLSVFGNTVSGDEIRIDGLQIVLGSSAPTYVAGEQSYTVDAHTGLVTFRVAPGSGNNVSWTGKYYWRCRFKKSMQEFEQFMKQLWTAKSIEFRTEKP